MRQKFPSWMTSWPFRSGGSDSYCISWGGSDGVRFAFLGDVYYITQRRVKDGWLVMNWKGLERKQLLAYLVSQHLIGGVQQTNKSHTQDNRCLCRYSNPTPPGHKSERYHYINLLGLSHIYEVKLSLSRTWRRTGGIDYSSTHSLHRR
jgi:hypothetical protein